MELVMQFSWKSYRLVDRANVFVAAALSLGIRPEDFQLRRGSNGRIEWEFSAYDDDGSAEMFRVHKDELQERVAVLEVVRFTKKLFCDDDHQMVALSKYAQYCIDNEIEPLAEEFIKLAASNITPPKSDVDKKPAKREKKSTEQENEILRILKEMKYNPKELPAYVSGRPWVKAEVKPTALNNKNLFSSENVFNKTWERLTSSGQIKQKL
jgi:hypothetical protein